MNRRPLGQTGLHVSELCLGTMSFGWRTRPATAITLLDAFHGAGGNLIEATQICPDVLTQPDWIGLPEACVGEWLNSRAVRRSELIIATRLIWSSTPALPAENLARCLEASLRRLQTDYLDLLVCDWTPSSDRLDDVLHQLTQLVEQGKVRQLAVPSFARWEMSESVRQTSSRSLEPIMTVQADYSLLDRRSEISLLAHPHRRQLGFLARSPLAGGYLTMAKDRPATHDLQRQRTLNLRYDHRKGRAIRAAVEAVAQELGATMAQVALAWVLSNPAVSAAVIAPLSANQLQDSIEATNLDLAWNQLRRLDLLSSSDPGQDETAGSPFVLVEQHEPAETLAS